MSLLLSPSHTPFAVPSYKECSVCGEMKPDSEYYASKGTQKAMCKACCVYAQQQRNRTRKPPPPVDASTCSFKECNKCGELKPGDEYYTQWHGRCKPCCVLDVQQRYHKKKESHPRAPLRRGPKPKKPAAAPAAPAEMDYTLCLNCMNLKPYLEVCKCYSVAQSTSSCSASSK